ncbi:nucleotidyltransferase family protein [Tepidimonas taiwanensis]|uniref:nucleotidyltransferase family protein n=1 Tax=Tepidimonas taiwanensis TaxID=307486 RepID=UPI001C8F6561|nr:nucleotidyltransferase family protein [Tepidimonas taiwanensis]MDM7462746.1 nucleotidyltransferase family protein [Tepidimonas taiwanensis]UBQ04660.1 nucleotidyltransferase family protein [Tepidimonas taiwanensis]
MLRYEVESMDRDDILDTLRRQRALLAERFGVRAIALFGSQARGDATPSSDIDLLVELDPAHRTLRNYFQLRDHLQQALGSPVDMSTPDALKPAIRHRVQSEAIYA